MMNKSPLLKSFLLFCCGLPYELYGADAFERFEKVPLALNREEPHVYAYKSFLNFQNHPEALEKAHKELTSPHTPIEAKRSLVLVLGALTDPEIPQNMHPDVVSIFLKIFKTLRNKNPKDPDLDLAPWMLLSLSSWRGAPEWPTRFNFSKDALYTRQTPEGLSIALREPVPPALIPVALSYLHLQNGPTPRFTAALETLRCSLSHPETQKAFIDLTLQTTYPEEQSYAAEALAQWIAYSSTPQTLKTPMDALIEAAGAPDAHTLRLKIRAYLYGKPLSPSQSKKLLSYLQAHQEFTLRDFALKLLGAQAAVGHPQWTPLIQNIAQNDPHPKIRENALDIFKELP